MSTIPGTNITAPIVPFDTNDVYPTHLDKYGKGGLRTVDSYVERDTIKPFRRKEGMEVYVVAVKKKFRLLSGFPETTNMAPENWEELTGSAAPSTITTIDELLDVNTAGITNNQVLVYNSSTQTYNPGTMSSGGIVQINVDIPPGNTVTVDSVPLNTSSSIKWIIVVTDDTTKLKYSSELHVLNNNSVLDFVQYAIMGELTNVSILPKIVGPNIVLEIHNSGINIFKSSNTKINLSVY